MAGRGVSKAGPPRLLGGGCQGWAGDSARFCCIPTPLPLLRLSTILRETGSETAGRLSHARSPQAHDDRCRRCCSEPCTDFSSVCTWTCFCCFSGLLLKQRNAARTKERMTSEANKDRRMYEFDGTVQGKAGTVMVIGPVGS